MMVLWHFYDRCKTIFGASAFTTSLFVSCIFAVSRSHQDNITLLPTHWSTLFSMRGHFPVTYLILKSRSINGGVWLGPFWHIYIWIIFQISFQMILWYLSVQMFGIVKTGIRNHPVVRMKKWSGDRVNMNLFLQCVCHHMVHQPSNNFYVHTVPQTALQEDYSKTKPNTKWQQYNAKWQTNSSHNAIQLVPQCNIQDEINGGSMLLVLNMI